MTWMEYTVSKSVGLIDCDFYALIMAAMRRADTFNAAKLRSIFPDVWAELDARYNAPGGWLPGETGYVATGDCEAVAP